MGAKMHLIDLDTCKGDGICVDVCPENLLEIVDEKAGAIQARRAECILCGQCVAVCPSEAIQMPDLPANLFKKLEKWTFDYADFMAFLQARRSVRNFKDKPVDRQLVDKIVHAASTAPMGFPPHTTEILAIDDREALSGLLKDTVKTYKGLVFAASNPLIRPFIKMKVGAEIFHELQQCVIPVARSGNEAFEKDGTDPYMYHAPVLMLFHANRWTPSYKENAYLTCSYSMLAAQSLGLGSTIIGMIPPIIDQSKDLRKRFEIPKDNKIITSLILGHPKYKYKKSIRREFPSVRFFGS